MPKTTRGRRPAPHPKKRPPRPFSRTAPHDAAAFPDAGVPGFAPGSGVVATTPVARAARPAPMASAPARRTTHAAPRRRFADSIADYAYVSGDLTRISLFAGGLIVLLVILSFVIR